MDTGTSAEPKQTIADLFRRMADRLEHNADDPFGGCFLICPPEGGGNVIETLILDASQDPSQFWILLKAKCDVNIQQIDQQARKTGAFGR